MACNAQATGWNARIDDAPTPLVGLEEAPPPRGDRSYTMARLRTMDDLVPDEQGAETSWFELPPDVEEPFEVYLNAIPQRAGVDFTRVGRALVFPRALKPEVKMSRIQLALATLGIAGTYRKYDSLDVIYHRDGRRLVATGLRPREDHA
jgi:hypothetical protein